MKNVLYLCCYDIVSDSCRKKVAVALETSGLERVQYSVFVGSLTYLQKRTLVSNLKKIVGINEANILIVRIGETCKKDALTHIGSLSINWDYLEKKVLTLIL